MPIFETSTGENPKSETNPRMYAEMYNAPIGCTACSYVGSFSIINAALAFLAGFTISRERAKQHLSSGKSQKNRIVLLLILAVFLYLFVGGTGQMNSPVLWYMIIAFALGFILARSLTNFDKDTSSFDIPINNF